MTGVAGCGKGYALGILMSALHLGSNVSSVALLLHIQLSEALRAVATGATSSSMGVLARTVCCNQQRSAVQRQCPFRCPPLPLAPSVTLCAWN